MNRNNKKMFIAELVHVNMRMMKYLLAQISCVLFGTQLLNFLTDKGIGMCKKVQISNTVHADEPHHSRVSVL
jgi:hypothetical protein